MPEFEPQSNIVSVAKQLAEDIISYCNTVPEHRWPPTFEGMTAEFGDAPDSAECSKNFTCSREQQNKLGESMSHHWFDYGRFRS